MGLIPNKCNIPINKEKFIELYKLGLNDSQIGKEMNIPKSSIKIHRLKLNLPIQYHTDQRFNYPNIYRFDSFFKYN